MSEATMIYGLSEEAKKARLAAEEMPKGHTPVKVSENQLKVIKDKYLKDSPTVDHWLMKVAANIALSEVIHHPDFDESKAFKGVKFEKWVTEYDGKKTVSYLLHKHVPSFNERGDNFMKFIDNLYVLSQDSRFNKVFLEWRDKFFNLMKDWKFLPNSPTLMNAGRHLQQLSACYVIPVDDNLESIYDSLKHMALIHKSGGGTGFSFSRLRPRNDEVKTTKGVSSGPISFMELFDKSTDVVKQGGTRRGANMGIMRYDHPDILEFISAKRTPGKLENFNISVAIDDNFMKKVKSGEDYDLINPRNGEVVGKLNAKEVWDLMIKSAWESGDPGFVVIDRINNSTSNPVPAHGTIESTNPCGEQPLLPYEPCNLGSINLSKFVLPDGSDMDWDSLKEAVKIATRFLDNVIDVNNYPLFETEYMAKATRRIGLGIMGLAETLVMLRLPYNSKDGLAKAEEIMKFINDSSRDYSVELAAERGVFPFFEDSIYDKKGKYFRGLDFKVRNSARTTIAPTGTIAIAAGLQGSGIEPFFSIVYTRYNARALDALKNGQKPRPEDTFFEVNPLFRKIAEENNYFGFKPDELWDKVEKNHKSLKGLKEIPEEIQNLFLTSHDLSPLDHVRMQVVIQKHTDNAVSKTVNLRNEATPDDVREVYELAYENGAKGVTIYRDGSKQFQVLNLDNKKESGDNSGNVSESNQSGKESVAASNNKAALRKKKEIESSTYYEIKTGYGPLHIHINYDEDGPTRVFTNLAPLGTEISGLTAAMGILISKYLEQGGKAEKLLKHLNSVKGDRPFGFGPNKVDSIPHAISKALRDHLIKTGHLELPNGQVTLSQITSTKGSAAGNNSYASVKTGSGSSAKKESIDYSSHERNPHETAFCPKCFSTNVAFMSGCSEPTCLDCGYSKCS